MKKSTVLLALQVLVIVALTVAGIVMLADPSRADTCEWHRMQDPPRPEFTQENFPECFDTTPTPSVTPTATPQPSPTVAPTPTPESTPTPAVPPSPTTPPTPPTTVEPSPTPSPTPTVTPSASPTPSPKPSEPSPPLTTLPETGADSADLVVLALWLIMTGLVLKARTAPVPVKVFVAVLFVIVALGILLSSDADALSPSSHSPGAVVSDQGPADTRPPSAFIAAAAAVTAGITYSIGYHRGRKTS